MTKKNTLALTLDTIQKDVCERDAHNERLEESIHNLGTEAQQLHEQYKQNQVGVLGEWILLCFLL